MQLSFMYYKALHKALYTSPGLHFCLQHSFHARAQVCTQVSRAQHDALVNGNGLGPSMRVSETASKGLGHFWISYTGLLRALECPSGPRPCKGPRGPYTRPGFSPSPFTHPLVLLACSSLGSFKILDCESLSRR